METWKKQDPIARLTEKLITSPEQSEAFANVLQQIDQEINSAFDFAENSPFPDIASRQTQIYHEEQQQ